MVKQNIAHGMHKEHNHPARSTAGRATNKGVKRMTTKITGLLEKETLSVYEFKEILGVISEKCNMANITQISDQIQEDIEYGADKIKGLLTTVQGMEERINKTLIESYENLEKEYEAINTKFNNLQKKFDALKLDFPKIQIPFGWSDIMNMVHRFSTMDKPQQDAFIKLSKELSK
jgi:seryl-tRNA synthetase